PPFARFDSAEYSLPSPRNALSRCVAENVHFQRLSTANFSISLPISRLFMRPRLRTTIDTAVRLQEFLKIVGRLQLRPDVPQRQSPATLGLYVSAASRIDDDAQHMRTFGRFSPPRPRDPPARLARYSI